MIQKTMKGVFFLALFFVTGAVWAVPEVATLISPSSTIYSRPVFKWQDQDDATQFRVQVYDRSVGRTVHLANSNRSDLCSDGVCTFNFGIDLGFSANHFFRVRSRNADGYAAWSPRMRFNYVDWKPVTPTPIAPLGDIISSTPTFQWERVSNAVDYQLYVYDRSTRTKVLQAWYSSDICSESICSVADEASLGFGSNHFWRVRARNTGGISANTTNQIFHYKDTIPDTVVTVAPNGSLDTASPTYSWVPADRATRYHFRVRNKVTSSWMVNEYHDSGEICDSSICQVSPGVMEGDTSDMYFHVRAYNTGGWGGWSVVRQFNYIGSFASATCADPVQLAAGGLSFGDTNCWYQVNNTTTSTNDICKGRANASGGLGDIACPSSFTAGEQYSVNKVYVGPGAVDGWEIITPPYTFTGTVSPRTCADPVQLAAGGLSFGDTNCWYQVNNTTTSTNDICKGRANASGGLSDIACPASFTGGEQYSVNKVYVGPGAVDGWEIITPPYTFTGLGTAGTHTCADPVQTLSGGLSFGDTNCWYQVNNTTTSTNDICKGRANASGGLSDIACPASFTVGEQYSVNKVYVGPGAVDGWETITPPYTFTPNGAESTVVIGNSIIRNRSHSSFFFDDQSTPIKSIPFGHINASNTPYGINDGDLAAGIYNADANDPAYTTRWGDATGVPLEPNSDIAGTNYHSSYDYTSNSNPNPPGGPVQGDFRIECQWSHFAYDDPIVNHVNKSANLSHLHMYWGNTSVDYSSELNPDSAEFFIKKGGSSCQGGPLNRSSYWMPALMHGDDKVMVPREIIVYYKSRQYLDASEASEEGLVTNTLQDIVSMPQGLQLIAGNGDRGAAPPPDEDVDDINRRNLNKRVSEWGGVAEKNNDNWTTSEFIAWECGTNGRDIHKFNRLPTAAEYEIYCKNQGRRSDDNSEDVEYEDLNATIYFPQCRKPTDEVNGNNLLNSADFRTHVKHVSTDSGCPAEHVRMPQLGYRIYWDITELTDSSADELSIDKLRLSSDPSDSDLEFITRGTREIRNAAPDSERPGDNARPLLNDELEDRRYRAATCDNGEVRVAGGTLHADWVAGWRDSVQDLWLDNCSRDGVACTLGQTGTSVALKGVFNNGAGMDYYGHPEQIENEAGVVVGAVNSYLIDVPTGSGMNMCSSGDMNMDDE